MSLIGYLIVMLQLNLYEYTIVPSADGRLVARCVVTGNSLLQPAASSQECSEFQERPEYARPGSAAKSFTSFNFQTWPINSLE